MDRMETENSYVDFTNDNNEPGDQEDSPLCAQRCLTEGISELSTEIDYFQFSKSDEKQKPRNTFTRPTAHF